MAYVVESYMGRAETSVSLHNSTPGLHKFFRSLEVTLMFYAPEGWYEASSIVRIHRY